MQNNFEYERLCSNVKIRPPYRVGSGRSSSHPRSIYTGNRFTDRVQTLYHNFYCRLSAVILLSLAIVIAAVVLTLALTNTWIFSSSSPTTTKSSLGATHNTNFSSSSSSPPPPPPPPATVGQTVQLTTTTTTTITSSSSFFTRVLSSLTNLASSSSSSPLVVVSPLSTPSSSSSSLPISPPSSSPLSPPISSSSSSLKVTPPPPSSSSSSLVPIVVSSSRPPSPSTSAPHPSSSAVASVSSSSSSLSSYMYTESYICQVNGSVVGGTYAAGNRGIYNAVQSTGAYTSGFVATAFDCQTLACNGQATVFNFVQYSSTTTNGCTSASCCYLWYASTLVYPSVGELTSGTTYLDGVVSFAITGIIMSSSNNGVTLATTPPPLVSNILVTDYGFTGANSISNDIYTPDALTCGLLAAASGGYYDSFTWVIWANNFNPCKGYAGTGNIPCCYLTASPSVMYSTPVPNYANSQLDGLSGFIQPYTYTYTHLPQISLGLSNVWPIYTAGPGLVSYTSGFYNNQNYANGDVNEAGYYYPITGSNADFVVAGVTIGACQQLLATATLYSAFGFIIYTSSSNGDCSATTCCHLISGTLTQSSTYVTPSGSIVKTYYGYLNFTTTSPTSNNQPVCNIFIPMPFGIASGASAPIQNAGATYITLATNTADECMQILCLLDPTHYIAAQWFQFTSSYPNCNSGVYCCYIYTAFWTFGGTGQYIPNPVSMVSGITFLRFN